jgi:hypothetical protein
MRAMRGGPPASDLVGRLPPPREHDGAPAGHRYLRPPAGLRRDPSGWSPSGACPGSPGGGRPARRAGGPNVTAAARAARMRSGPHSRPPRQASRCLRRSQTSADQLDCGALAGLAGRMGAGQRTGAHALESRRPPPKRSLHWEIAVDLRRAEDPGWRTRGGSERFGGKTAISRVARR